MVMKSAASRSQKLMPRSSVAFENHVKDVVVMLNKVLRKYKIKVKMPKDMSRTVSGAILKSFQDGRSVKGRVYLTHIECLAEIIRALMYFDAKSKCWHYQINRICVTALTQSGKTGLIIACAFLPVIFNLMTNNEIRCVIRRFLLTANELEKQADQECQNFSDMYRHLKFNDMSLHEYIETIKTEDGYTHDCEIPPAMPVTGFSYRHTKSLIPLVEEHAHIMRERGITLINIGDEIHARIGCEKDGRHALRDMVTPRDMMTPEDSVEFCPEDTFIGVSATTEVLYYLNQQEGGVNISFLPGGVVYQEKHADKSKLTYTGWGWLHNKKLFNLNVPIVKSFEMFDNDAKSGISRYCNDVRKMITTNPIGVSAAMAKMLKYIFKKHLASGLGAGKGILIRMDYNVPTSGIVELLKQLMKNVCIWSHTPAEDGDLTLEQAVDKRCGPASSRKPYVVFVTGRARCGSVAPSDCRCGIEFAKDSDPQVISQGIPGRMTGYFKGVPLIILSEINAAILNRHIQTGLWQKPGRDGDWVDISTYKPYMTVAYRSSTYIAPRFDMSDQLASDLELLANRVAVIKDGKINRIETRGVMPVEWLEQVFAIAESHGRKPDRTPLDNAKDGNVAVQIRRSSENGGSQGGTRQTRCQETGIRADPVIRVAPDLVGGNLVFDSVKIITADYEMSKTDVHRNKTVFYEGSEDGNENILGED